MITHEVRAEVSNGIDGVIEISAAGLMPSDSWERPDAVISTAKQKAHDDFFLDTPGGEWLSPGKIAQRVHEVTSAFVGETPLGRRVFLVAPAERTRPINQKNIPLDAHFAFAHALEREFLQAVQNAEDQHLITHEEAVRQAGHMDSGAARVLRKPFRNQNKDVIRDGALAASQAAHIAIPVGIAGAGIALAARKKDEHGRLFRNVGKVMYGTSAGVTVGSLVLSACTSVQALPTQEVRVTPMPEQFNPTVDQATQAVASWVGMRVPLAEGEFGVFPTQAIFEVDQTDSTGQKLKTLSLLNPDGRTTDPDLRYAMGLALIPSEKTGETVDLPFLVQLGKNGEALMLGMFLDSSQSTEEVGVFRLNIVKDGQIRPVTQEMVVTKVAGGVTIELRDISDPKNIVTYHLVSTPKEAVISSQQSVVPSQVPDNKWIDKVIAFMSGSGIVHAAEPSTPEQLASATPLPTSTPEPTTSPDGVEVAHIERADVEVLGVQVHIELVTDKSLQTRKDKQIQQILFNGYYEDPREFHTDVTKSKLAVAEGIMRGIWWAWKDDDANRVNTSFETYMQMVAEYQAGQRPLVDVAYKVFANDLTQSEYHPKLTEFDPTTPVRVVYTNSRDKMTTYDIVNASDDFAVGTERNADGGLELWIHDSIDTGQRTSSSLTGNLAVALVRLTWDVKYQTKEEMAANTDPTHEPDTYHPDISRAIIYPDAKSNVHIGAINVDEASSDFYGR